VQQIVLVGFSMGGNQTLLTLAQPDLEPQVIGGVGFSVPLDLAACAGALARPAQRLYMRRFLRDLKIKIADKAARFPDRVSLDGYDRIRTFKEFDDRYTAPLHGFRDAQDYWQQCSSGRVVNQLQRPALVVNALDDPFLAPGCYRGSGMGSALLHMETPQCGGHCGFIRWRLNEPLWSEQRALRFADALVTQHRPQTAGAAVSPAGVLT
jgi:predicted alpha/beta-fold hydrolase